MREIGRGGMGVVYRAEEAVAAGRRAIELEPLGYPLQQPGGVLLWAEKYEEALAGYQRGIDRFSGAASLETGLAWPRRGLEQWSPAIEASRCALDLDQTDAMAWLCLADSSYQVHDDAGAIGACGHAIELRPSLADAYLVKADVRMRLGELEAAIDTLEQGRSRVDPADPGALAKIEQLEQKLERVRGNRR